MLCDDAETETELNIPELGRTIHSALHRCAAVTVTRSQHLGGKWVRRRDAGCGAVADTLLAFNKSSKNSRPLLSLEMYHHLCGQWPQSNTVVPQGLRWYGYWTVTVHVYTAHMIGVQTMPYKEDSPRLPVKVFRWTDARSNLLFSSDFKKESM